MRNCFYRNGFDEGYWAGIKFFSREEAIKSRYQYYLDSVANGVTSMEELQKDNEFLTTQKMAKKYGFGQQPAANLPAVINNPTNPNPNPNPTNPNPTNPKGGNRAPVSTTTPPVNSTNSGFNKIKTDVVGFVKNNPIKTAGIGLGLATAAGGLYMLGKRSNSNENENR